MAAISRRFATEKSMLLSIFGNRKDIFSLSELKAGYMRSGLELTVPCQFQFTSFIGKIRPASEIQ